MDDIVERLRRSQHLSGFGDVLCVDYRHESLLQEAADEIERLRELDQRGCECSQTEACALLRERDEARRMAESWRDRWYASNPEVGFGSGKDHYPLPWEKEASDG